MPISSTGITVVFITDNNVWSTTTTFTRDYLFNVFLNDLEIKLGSTPAVFKYADDPSHAERFLADMINDLPYDARAFSLTSFET